MQNVDVPPLRVGETEAAPSDALLSAAKNAVHALTYCLSHVPTNDIFAPKCLLNLRTLQEAIKKAEA